VFPPDTGGYKERWQIMGGTPVLLCAWACGTSPCGNVQGGDWLYTALHPKSHGYDTSGSGDDWELPVKPPARYKLLAQDGEPLAFSYVAQGMGEYQANGRTSAYSRLGLDPAGVSPDKDGRGPRHLHAKVSGGPHFRDAFGVLLSGPPTTQLTGINSSGSHSRSRR